jgi:hypothetical protein
MSEQRELFQTDRQQPAPRPVRRKGRTARFKEKVEAVLRAFEPLGRRMDKETPGGAGHYKSTGSSQTGAAPE